MDWVRHNQNSIRVDTYNGLLDAIAEGDLAIAGQKIILLPTIFSSPRFYSEEFQNATTIVRFLGKPDYFITCTTNPNWPKIVEALNPGEKSNDKPDIACRISHLKYNDLMENLTKKHILGHVNA